LAPPVMHFYSGPPMHLLSGVDSHALPEILSLSDIKTSSHR
jgi:hypothetical protein